MDTTLKEGLTHTSTRRVEENDTACLHGSGDMDVFATPAMVALMENAAMLAVADHLPEGSTTVGTAIAATHSKASPLGAEVSATAILRTIDGRRLDFEITAEDHQGSIGKASHSRFIVDRERFLSKLK